MILSRRSPLFLKYIILERIAKGSLAFLIGIGGLSLGPVRLNHLLYHWAQNLNIDTDNAFTGQIFRKTGLVGPNMLMIISVGGVVYGLLNLVVAWGLHRRFRWAEYMTIIEISALIPLEVYAMHSHFSNWRLGAFVLNVLIVIYLLKNRQLFHGIHETADSVDPA
ncbi:MAG: DUF2127 domain-containing protein [Leptospirales bacterium]|jgi:uncharacterized membrane protein (DUF2068 family)